MLKEEYREEKSPIMKGIFFNEESQEHKSIGIVLKYSEN